MAECAKGVYRPRRPRETAFYHLVEEHYECFEQVYPERYENRYGFFRSVIGETVYRYLGCGDLKQGFARVRCRECGHEYLLGYSCKRRYFCTSCHTKRAGAITRSFRVLLEEPDSEPGLVVCVHSFGNLLNFHPHLHVMATAGAFTPEGVFHPLPTMSLAPIEELFRHRVFKMLLRKGLLTPERFSSCGLGGTPGSTSTPRCALAPPTRRDARTWRAT